MSYKIAYNTHNALLNNLEKKLTELLNAKSGRREIRIVKIEMPEAHYSDDMSEQKNAKIQGISYSSPVKGTFELLEDGKIIDKKSVKLFDLPNITRRGTYIVGGNEYHFPLQKRLIPGVYTTEKNDGTISAWLNSSKGRNMEIILREKGDFIISVEKASTINLLAFLTGMGVDPSELRRAWGEEVYNTNAAVAGAGNPLGALEKFYEKTHYVSDPEPAKKDIPGLRAWITDYFNNKSEFDGDNVKITLGEGHTKTSPKLMVDSTIRMLDVSRGNKPEDNKESLIHNSVHDLSDFMVERVGLREYASKVKRTLERNLKDPKKDTVSKIYQADLVQKPVDSTFTQISISKMPKQNNPMDTMASFSEITVMGEGGISDLHQVTRDVRALDPTHFAFIDPAHTPEGENIGTTLHLSSTAQKVGKDLVQMFVDLKTKKQIQLNPRQVYVSHVTFPEYWDFKAGKIKPDKADGLVRAMYMGELKRVKPQEVQYSLIDSTQLLGVNTMAVPFVSHNNGTRIMTAAKMQSQAKPLKYREAPLIQSLTHEGSEKSVEQIMAHNILAKSPADGVVKSVSPDKIVIKGDDGKEYPMSISNKFWMNENNYEHEEPVVKVGDKVKKGQLLSESNYTKDGTLALGTNLNTAYVSYKGLNHEDGVVISETGADKLTSMHAYQHPVAFTDQDVIDKKKFTSHFPATFNQNQTENIDDQGVIKVGSLVVKGDPLVLKMRKVEEDTISRKLANVSRLLIQDFKDTSDVWDKGTQGKIAEVHVRKKDILIVIETEEKAKIGDKLVGRFGNKGTITTIISDDEMPKDEKGQAMDILFDPTGVPGRMNLGQILETTASKISEKTGKPYMAKPFGGDHTNAIGAELDKLKLKDHNTLTDGDIKIEGVLAGKQYFLKLEHMVDKKLSARGAGVGYSYTMDGQPSKGSGTTGQAIGLGEMYALLAHGAQANLAEMYTFKSDKSLETWRAIENGTFMPPPEMPAASERFVGMLRGMGVDLVEDDKNVVKMTPFLDRDVRKISNGEIKDATVLRAKDLKEEKGGLYDFKTTGGLQGDKWSHIELTEPIPHPTFEFAILAVTRLKKQEFEDIMAGKLGVKSGKVISADEPGAASGGEGIKALLGSIDVDSRLEEMKSEAQKAKGSDLNKLHREARVLKNFRDNKIDLREMVVSTIPVLPPKFRPIVEMTNGDINVADVNEHYRAAILMNNHLKEYKGRPGLRDEANKVRRDLFEGMRGVMGMSTGLVTKPDVKGIAEQIAGSSPKYGYFHSKLLKRRQETSGRGVVGPGPELDMDSLGIPENMAWNMFEPYVIKDLKAQGLTSMRAREEIDKRSPFARDALTRTMDVRPVIMNRAPTLHKFSIMAFKPKLVPGSAIKVPIEVLGGLNMDFDGDCLIGEVFYCINSNSGIMTDTDGSMSLHLDQENTMAIKHDNIANFPRTNLVSKKGNVEFYEVPAGTQVFSYDKTLRRVRLMDVSLFSVHHDLSMRKVNYRSGRNVEVSAEHSLFCMSSETLELDRHSPDTSVGLFTPRPRKIDLPDSVNYVEVTNASEHFSAKKISTKIALDEVTGYFIGAMIGDGYATAEDGRIGLCNLDQNVIDYVQIFMDRVGVGSHTEHENAHTFRGFDCHSKKAHWTSINLNAVMSEWIGRGAINKHLPEFWMLGDLQFRKGLLSGLLDTDGTVNYVKAKNKDVGQYQTSYTTKSNRLADEVVLLCASLNVRASITKFKNGHGDWFNSVSISSKDLSDVALSLKHERKAATFAEIFMHEFGPSKVDVVPCPKDLAQKIRLAMGCPRNASDEHRSIYSSLGQYGVKKGRMLRETILRLMTWTDVWQRIEASCKEDPRFNTFADMVRAENILWDEVESVENLGDGHTAYDLTVPESLVFMVANTIIVYDTASVHVPSSPEAVKEAWGMVASKNLYQSGTAREKLSPSLGREYMLGVFKLTRDGKTTSKMYENAEMALRDAVSKKIGWTDIISVKGLSGGRPERTTAGKIKINQTLPSSLRDYQATYNENYQKKILTEVGKLGGETFKKIIGDWKDAGRIFVYESGTSFLLSDLKALTKERKAFYAQADIEANRVRSDTKLSKEQKEAKIIEIYGKVDRQIKGMSMSLPDNRSGKSNNIADMVASGMSKPGPDQLKQLVGTVGLMMDHRQQIIPEPVRGNYAEGLDTAEFFQHMYSQRKGMIDKSRSVSGPGMLSKELTNSGTQQKITMIDCNTMNGVNIPPDKNLLDRMLAAPVAGIARNTAIDGQLLGKIQAAKIPMVKMRSVLTCEAANGVCAMCFGIDDNGNLPRIGANVGISEIQSVTERSVQLPMKAFHCNHPGTLVFVKKGDETVATTMEALWHDVTGVPHIKNGIEMKWAPDDWMIHDANGWAELVRVARHAPDDKIVQVKLKSSHTIVCQANHPLMLRRIESICGKCGESALSVEGSGRNQTYSVRCATCSSRQKISKEVWGQMLVRSVEAKDAAPGMVAKVSLPPIGGDGWVGDINDAWLLGFFLAEGSFNIRAESEPKNDFPIVNGNVASGGHNCVALHISQLPGEIYDEASNRLNALGFDHKKYDTMMTIFDAKLARRLVMKTGQGAVNKRLPQDFMMSATGTQMGDILSGWIDGDGCIVQSGEKNSTHISATSTSYAIVQSMFIMASHLGMKASVDMTTNKELTRNQAWCVRIIPTQEQAKEHLSASVKCRDIVFTSTNEEASPTLFDTGVAHVRDVFGELPFVYDVTTSTGTFCAGGVWNHNSGGVASADKGQGSAFDRALTVFRIPETVPGKATLSELSGRVEGIRPSGYGGFIVTIGGKEHKVSKGLEVTVKMGDMVEKGDKISTGMVKAQEMLKLKGLQATQGQIAQDLDDAFRSGGIKFNRRTYEVASRMLTEQVRISDPGDNQDFVPGDYTTVQKVDAWNKQNPGKKKIQYNTILPGTQMAPMMTDDWARRMSLSRIKGTIEEGAAMGFKSDRKQTVMADLVLGPNTRIKRPGEKRIKL